MSQSTVKSVDYFKHNFNFKKILKFELFFQYLVIKCVMSRDFIDSKLQTDQETNEGIKIALPCV